MIVIEDIIGKVVGNTENELNNKNKDHKMELNFCFGTLREIVEVLNDLTRAKLKKYPLIIMIEPFTQNIDGSGVRASARFLIATYTKKNLKADQRLNFNYRTVLFPIYEAFMNQLKLYTRSSELPHKMINHFELGRESLSGYDSATLNDHVDAIEIKDAELYFRKENECKTKTKNF